MASIKQALNTAAAMTITLSSLANGAGRAATAIDNTTGLYLDADVRVKVKTNAAGTSATGYCDVYLLSSEDGTNYDDTFGGTDAAATPVNARKLGTMTTNVNATTYVGVFSVASLGITLPAKWSIIVVNNSGAALDATAGNHSVTYREKYLTVA